MLRSLAAQMDPVPGARSVTAARVINAVRVAGLIIVVVTTVWLARPGPASGGARGPAIAVMLGVCAVAWTGWASRPMRVGDAPYQQAQCEELKGAPSRRAWSVSEMSPL